MIYKITRLILILAILTSLVMCISLFMGWMGISSGLLVIKMLLITIGIYVFYETRGDRNDSSIIRFIKLPVHFLVFPVIGLAIWSIGSEEAGKNYWFIINFILVLFLGIVLINLIAKNNFKPLVKAILLLLIMAYISIILLQMSGYLASGQVVLFSSCAIVLCGLAAVMAGVNKKQSNSLRS